MKKQEDKKEENIHQEGKRYLKKFEIVETDVYFPLFYKAVVFCFKK